MFEVCRREFAGFRSDHVDLNLQEMASNGWEVISYVFRRPTKFSRDGRYEIVWQRPAQHKEG